MDADVFKDIIVPVIGGLGIFMLGLEFMERGIQALSANKMKELMTKMAGSPAKGVLAGTVITGVIQSSTAMTVMTVGLVNAGILTLRGAIGVIMGATSVRPSATASSRCRSDRSACCSVAPSRCSTSSGAARA